MAELSLAWVQETTPLTRTIEPQLASAPYPPPNTPFVARSVSAAYRRAA